MPDVGDFILASDVAVPPGIVAPFYNVTLNGRYPIFWGKTEADTGWLVCDGGSDLHGGTVPNLINKFIMGTNTVSEAKKTGGSTTTSSTSTSGTVEATTITNSNAGSHSHIIGNYYYGPNSTGTDRDAYLISSVNNTLSLDISASASNPTVYIGGCVTSKSGANATSLYIKTRRFGSNASIHVNTGASSSTSGSHTHSFTGSSHTHTVTPPYYKLIYLVKLP